MRKNISRILVSVFLVFFIFSAGCSGIRYKPYVSPEISRTPNGAGELVDSVIQERGPGQIPRQDVSRFLHYYEMLGAIKNGYFAKDGTWDHTLAKCITDHINGTKIIPEPEAKKQGKENYIIHTCFPEDKRARYQDPEMYALEKVQMRGEFSGIGVSITMDENDNESVRVLGVVPDSAAERSGKIKENDRILAVKVGDRFMWVRDLTLAQAVLKIIGPEGSQVTLRIKHENGLEEDITLTRQKVKIQSVQFHTYRAGKETIGYIRIISFDGDFVKKYVVPQMKEWQKQGIHKVAVDVRKNPGGILLYAEQMLGLFLPASARPYMQLRGRWITTPFHIHQDGPFKSWKVAVLADGDSASASEIVAGVLQNEGVMLIGKKTYGKGSVQTISELSNRGAFYYTIALYYFRDGKTPEDGGLTPKILVSNPEGAELGSEEDAQLKKAIEYLSNGR